MPSSRLRAVAAAVPSSYVDGAHFASLFGAEESGRIDKMAGLVRRPRLQPAAQPIDLAVAAARAVLEFARLAPAEIDAVVYVTQTPEFKLPASACLLQQRLELPTDAAAFDVNLGCSGYVHGLSVAAAFVRSGIRRRVLLVAGDASSRITTETDHAVAPLFGDAMSATIVEAGDGDEAFSPFVLGTDGRGWSDLVAPVGQCAFPDRKRFDQARPPELEHVADPHFLAMKGGDVFLFTMSRVPGLVAKTLEDAKRPLSAVDYFVFHQANRFILEQLRRKAKIPPEKMLYSLEDYANTSSASLPLTICARLQGLAQPAWALLVGFGVGYSWGATVARLEPGSIGPVVSFAP